MIKRLSFLIFLSLSFPSFLSANHKFYKIYEATQLTEVKIIDNNLQALAAETVQAGDTLLFNPAAFKKGTYHIYLGQRETRKKLYVVVNDKLPGGFLKIEYECEFSDHYWDKWKHHLTFFFYDQYEGHFFIDVRGLGNIEKHPYTASALNPERSFSFSPGTYRMEIFCFNGKKKGNGHLATLDLELIKDFNAILKEERRCFLKSAL